MFWAIIGLVFIGLSWTLVGVVLGGAPKKGLQPEIVIFFGALAPTVISGFLLWSGAAPAVDWFSKGALLGILFYSLSAFFNFLMQYFLALTMQKGPNGIIWSITQSGMLLTFLFGVIFKGDLFTWVRAVGMVLLLIALALLGLARDNQVKGNQKKWVLGAFLCFALCGTNQILAMIPSYIPEVRDGFNSVARSFICSFVTVTAGLLLNIARQHQKFFVQLGKSCCNKYLWIYTGIQQGFGLFGAYFIHYRCIDYLSARGQGAIAYPILVASCIAGFALYSILFLREKTSLIQKIGIIASIAGVIIISIVH